MRGAIMNGPSQSPFHPLLNLFSLKGLASANPMKSDIITEAGMDGV